MSTATAQLVIIAIGAISLVVWMIAFRFVWRSDRICRGEGGGSSGSDDIDPFADAATYGFDNEPSASPYLIKDEKIVRVDARTLAEELPKHLLQQNATFGPVQLIDAGPDRVEFSGHASLVGVVEAVHRTTASSWTPNNQMIKHGLFTIEPIGESQSRLSYEIIPARIRSMLIIARIINLVSLLIIFALGISLWIFVAGSEHENVRGQSIQMVQVVHALWPPFLFAGIARGFYKRLKAGVDTLISNIEVLHRGA